MRTLSIALFFTLLISPLFSQTTTNPYVSYSNAKEFTISEVRLYSTYSEVDLTLYTTSSDYSFFIHPRTYLQNYKNPGTKYHVKSLKNLKLNTYYYPKAYTYYTLTLVFPGIPDGITKLQMIEPESGGGLVSWYWKNIVVNNPSSYNSYSSASSNAYTGSAVGSFFKNTGVALLAFFAHPTNSYIGGDYQVFDNYVRVNIKYKDGYRTSLKIRKISNLFSGLEVISDNDWAPPFLAMTMIKQLSDEYIADSESDDKSKVRSKLESYLQKKYYEFDGIDISLFTLNLAFLAE